MKTSIDRDKYPAGCKQKGHGLRARPDLVDDPDARQRLLAQAKALVHIGLKRGWLKLPEPTPEATPPAGKRAVIDELVARVLLKFKL
jgi:hypothetical protein